ncbi:MAG: LysR family transcriptional regulator [Rhodanobacter sp. 68-29]|uniref:LysR family transcriptional regulator n=1 Tax=Rhodanobacter sp. PCA2 TaxID=2006117 RepID=UPI0008697127|nr:LysR family transcriptional regulator [Rhodanobacter sp. PCA2]MBA2079762.1 LysR family transcriptional regulator [Rhodanobacter sp. PCA2]MBN8923725.1 LysR family transcriptional regulator [Rhodanobacter sp.]ODU75603.1 MAG: LysR family transcriptional regulator [Rhodanobacter sp. SCN 69-32]OJY56891.1 MAG: LysR family transcriptional regulator [Rhodanobacter sp. 68-29]
MTERKQTPDRAKSVKKTRRSAAKKRAGDEATGAEAARYYYKGNRHKQLRAFVATVKLGTLSRAAESLYLSQPSVSLQLQALERELGVALLERRRRRINLTDAGEALYELARPLVEGWENLDRDFQAKVQGLQAGKLTIAAGTSTIQYLLPDLVRRYREHYPAVHLQLANVTGKDGLAMLREDKADFAVGSMLDVPHDIAWAPVRHYDPMLILPPGHPLATKEPLQLQDLSPYGLILPPQRLSTYRLVDLVFQQNQVPYQVAIEVGGWDVIKEYVAMGLGISIVTGICITDADRERLVVRNMQRWFPQRSYGVVVRKGKFLSAEARAFIDLVRPGLLTYRDYDESGHSER